MKILRFGAKTLTPLWTGGADRNSAQPHETGLLGSLRWWYEGIVRGIGGRVCNITADDTSKRCVFEQKADESFESAFSRLCVACRLFGCTGWRRRFRLEFGGLQPQNLFFVASSGVYQAAGNWLWRIFGGDELGGEKEGRGGNVTFSFGVQALWGAESELRVVPLGGDVEGALSRFAFLLDTVVRWGLLGAKPQHGFGQMQITSGLDQTMVAKGQELILAEAQSAPGNSEPDFFNLGRFFSNIYQLTQPEPYRGSGREIGTPPANLDYRQHFIPCAFDIRYKSRSKDFRTHRGSDFGMRPWFREKWGKNVAHRLFGRSDARSDDERSAGRIGVSHLYRTEPEGPWHLKVWGHVPSNLRDDQHRSISVEEVSNQLTAFVQTMFPNTKLSNQFDRKEVLGR